MPGLHQSDSWKTTSNQQESVKKKTLNFTSRSSWISAQLNVDKKSYISVWKSMLYFVRNWVRQRKKDHNRCCPLCILIFLKYGKRRVQPILSCLEDASVGLYEPPHNKTNKMTFAHSEDSDQPGHLPSLISLRCPHEETLDPQLPTDQTGWMPRLIWVFAGHTDHFVGFVMRQLKWRCEALN